MRYDHIIESMIWSYSRLTSFEQCPYQWLQKYILGIKGESKFFAQYGSFMHTVMQMYLTGELLLNQLGTYYLMNFSKVITAKAPNAKIYQNYLEQGRQYLKGLPFPARRILSVEDRTNFQYAGRSFVGFIDVISENDGTLYITDHKSRSLKPRSNRHKPTKSDAELDSFYRQLYVYSAAVKARYGRFPDILEFNCFRTQTWIAEPFQIERYEEVEEWAAHLIERIIQHTQWQENLDYWFCTHLCDLNHSCEYVDFL